jgi:hypothetical protein
MAGPEPGSWFVRRLEAKSSPTKFYRSLLRSSHLYQTSQLEFAAEQMPWHVRVYNVNLETVKYVVAVVVIKLLTFCRMPRKRRICKVIFRIAP